MNCSNYRVRQAGRGLGLTLEALVDFRIGDQVRGQKLQRDPAFKLRVLGEPDLAHAALAELLEDLIVADRSPNQYASILPL